jgi:hypothetical protein
MPFIVDFQPEFSVRLLQNASTHRIFYSFVASFLLLVLCMPAVSSAMAYIPGKAPASGASASGVIIPLYSYPGSSWNAIIQQKVAYPSVPITVIVNPSSGPGASKDPNYATWINNLRSAGVNVLGYVYTSYGARSASSVVADINAYKAWYGVNGIFLDEMSNVAGHESYYSALTSYAHSLGLNTVVGNPGAAVPSSYIGAVDVIVIYENAGIPSASALGSSTMGLSKSGFATMSYGVSSLTTSSVSAVAAYVGYVFITDESMPNPYSALPSYLAKLVSDLTATPSTMSSLLIQSADMSGNAVTGLWTTVSYNGNVVASGFTPLAFNGTTGAEYTVSVSNYGEYLFSHWESGNGSPSRTITLTQSMTLTATYSTSATINVQSVAQTGGAFSGMWTTVAYNSNIMASGFTSLSYTGVPGDSYTVCVGNYGSFTFIHWDDQSTDSCRTVTLVQNVLLTATYTS